MDFSFLGSLIFVWSSESNMQVITWAELVAGLISVMVMWYGYVLLKFYRHRLFRRGAANDRPVKWVREQVPQGNSTPPGDVHAQVRELMQEIREVFAAASKEQLHQQQVFEALGHRLSKYNHLPEDIRSAVTQHVVNEFSLQLNTSVTQQQINALW